MITVRHNLPDFRNQMQQLGRDFIPVVSLAGRAAAREFAKEVRKTAPRDTGKLARAVVVKRMRRVPRGTVGYIVGIRQGRGAQSVRRRRKGKATTVDLDAYYWRFLEGGWVPRRAGTQLRGGRRTKALQARRARASGGRIVRHRFLEPAFRAADGRALAAFTKTIEERAQRLQK